MSQVCQNPFEMHLHGHSGWEGLHSRFSKAKLLAKTALVRVSPSGPENHGKSHTSQYTHFQCENEACNVNESTGANQSLLETYARDL